MDFEKIKEFVLEKKLYFIVAVILLVGGLWLKKGDEAEDSYDNAQKMSQSSSANTSASAKVNSASSASNSATTNSKTVTCDISGAVKHQGVYTLKKWG